MGISPSPRRRRSCRRRRKGQTDTLSSSPTWRGWKGICVTLPRKTSRPYGPPRWKLREVVLRKRRTNRTQKKGGNEGTRTHLSKQETLRKILDVIIVDPDAFDYAMNELRGLFFAELLVKYDDLLADRFNNGMNERRSTSHRPSDVTQYREPEFISERMSILLAHLCRLADVFARSFLLVVEDIPRVFGLVLDS